LKNISHIDSPEMAGVSSATRITALLISALYTFAFNIISLVYTPEIEVVQISFAGVSFVFLVISAVFHRHDLAPLMALIALQITSINLTLYSPTEDISATSSTAIFLSVIFGITTLKKEWIPGWILVNVIHLAILVSRIDNPTIYFGIEMPLRTFSIIQLVTVAFWFNHSWFKQLEYVKARDALNKRMADSRESAIELQERTRRWRELLVHTHETVLNDIRSVLDSKKLDFDELKKQVLARRKLTHKVHPDETYFSDLMAQVQENVTLQIDLNITGAGTEIPHNIFIALRSAIVEICRNFERHSKATKISAKASIVYGVLRIELFHNGKDTITSFDAGIGEGIVIRETLAEINAKFFRRISGIEISISLNQRQPAFRTLGSTDLGRIAVSAVCVANAVGGVLFSLSLLQSNIPSELVAGLCTFILTIFAAVVNWRRVPLNKNYMNVVTSFSVVQAVSTFFAIGATNSLDVLAINSVLAGFALISTIAWADSVKLWLCGIPWLVGLIAFRTQIDPDSSGTAIASLNTGYGIPAFAAAAVFGIIRGNQRLLESKELSALEIRERIFATSFSKLAKELDTTINDATKLLLRIAKDREVSPASKNSLRRIDSLIRAIIQVDPKTSGGFSKAALEIVRFAVENGVQIKVLMIRDQGLLLELPQELIDELKSIVQLSRDSKTAIQVLANSNSSILILKVSRNTAKKFKFDFLQNYVSDNFKIKLEETDGEFFIFVEQLATA
jgi:anti-sigma regulatory factor (Ser/Thr protein kinase)